MTALLSFVNGFRVFREAYLIAGDYPHESIYMLQHLFNNWFTNLDIQKMTAAAVMLVIVTGGVLLGNDICAVTMMLVLMVFPLFVLVTDSFLGSREILERFGPVFAGTKGQAKFVLFPQYPTLRAYVQLLLDSPEFFTAFWNSVFQTGMILAGQLVVAVPGAWAFSRYRFPGKGAMWFLYMLLMILPFQVTMVSGYLVLSAVHMMDTHWAVILPEIFSTLPVFILKKTFSAIPQEILEAAEADAQGS